MRKELAEEQSLFLTELVIKYGDALTKYANRFYGFQPHMVQVAQEAVQETYIKAIQDVETLMTHENPLGWLKVSLRNVLLNQRRDNRVQFEELNISSIDAKEYQYHKVLDAFDMLDNYPRLSEVEEVVNAILSPGEVDTFYDHFLMGLTTEETALLEGVSSDTVRGRISRIRKKMRKYFNFPCVLLFLLFYSL